jgi:hypothetical protein
MKVPLQQQKCTGWCSVSAVGTVHPIFFIITITYEHYQEVLENFLPFLLRHENSALGNIPPKGLDLTAYSN